MTKNKAYFISLMVSIILITNAPFVYGNKAINIANEGIIRDEPNFDSKIKNIVSLGKQLNIVETKEDWSLIEYEEDSKLFTGWIYKDLIISELNKEELKVGKVTTNVLNVRSGPTTDSTLLTSLRRNEEVDIIGEKDVWYQIILNNGIKGWVHGEYIEVNIRYNYPRGQVIKKTDIQVTNGEKDNILSNIEVGTNIYIKGYEKERYNIIIDDVEGWIKASHVELNVNILNPVNRSGSRTQTLHNIKSITSKYIGTPYRYGSSGPTSFDCSGFVTYIYNKYYGEYLREKQIQLPRSSKDMANIGMDVSKSDLLPGDLVFFNNGKNKVINHVGIYIGDGNFIHSASGGRRGIVVSSLHETVYVRTYAKGIRI